MRTRAERRHKRELRKDKVVRMVRDEWHVGKNDQRDVVIGQMLKQCDCLQYCRRSCCCNARRDGWIKDPRTRQEKLADLRLKEDRRG